MSKNKIWNTPIKAANDGSRGSNGGYNRSSNGGYDRNRSGYNRGNYGTNNKQTRNTGGAGLNTDSPYAFVPFAADEPLRLDLAKTYENQESLMTGWFDVRMISKTELLMPDGSKMKTEANDHKTMPFYTTPDGTPAVPGSELRGMIRSTYEAVSNSCLPFVLDNKQTSMRLPTYAALKSRGLLEYRNGKWLLYSAFDHSIRAEAEEKDSLQTKGKYYGHRVGDTVYYERRGAACVLSNTAKTNEGILQFSNPVVFSKFNTKTQKKEYYHVHVLEKNELLYTWEDNTPYDALIEELTREGSRKNIPDKAEAVHKDLLVLIQKVKKEGCGIIPVFYLKTESRGTPIYYLAVSSIGRINQIRKWEDIMADYGPCTCTDRSCPACQLFGNIYGNMLIRGRVRVTDALPVNTVQLLDYRTLPILGGPKPTAFEYYIRKPNQDAKFWNYDFYSTTMKTASGKGTEAAFFQREDFSPLGRKYYWHHKPIVTKEEKGNLNLTTQPAPAGSVFNFRVYFDQITEEQYRQLLWVLTLGENREDSSLQLKIGHGRPFGYGSIKLIVKKAHIRKMKMENEQLSWTMEEKTVGEKMLCPFRKEYKNTIDALLTICDTTSNPKHKTSYPLETDKNGKIAIFNWYALNRRINSDHPSPDTLPDILDNAQKPRKTEFENS